MAYLSSHGLETLWAKLKTTYAGHLDSTTGTDKITIKLQDNAGTPNDLDTLDINAASSTTAGLMSKTDYEKLAGIEDGANKYVHPTTAGNKHVPSGGASGNVLIWDSEGTAKWGSAPASGGVTKLVAGSNVSLNPAEGTGEVTVTATDTTYESKTASSGGTDVSLVTTGEKYTWGQKQDALEFISTPSSTNKVATSNDLPTHKTAASGGSDNSLVTTGEMYTWNQKQDAIEFQTAYSATTNKAATMSDIEAAVTGVATYKGALNSEADLTGLTTYKTGWYYIVGTSWTSTLLGITLDVGNMIFVKKDKATTVAAGDFDVIQADIEAIADDFINALV